MHERLRQSETLQHALRVFLDANFTPVVQADKFEQMVLEAFQKKVTAEVPVPSGADGIHDYPERDTNVR